MGNNCSPREGAAVLAYHVKIMHDANADVVLNKVMEHARSEYNNISHLIIQIERELLVWTYPI